MTRALALVAALGVALSGCTSTEPQSVAMVPPVVELSRTVPVLPPPGLWRITKTEWTNEDEAGFGAFVRAIAQSGCSTTISCMQSAANFYHDTDPAAFRFHADCAKWAYMLRAYYASKNGLPFSYVDKISSDGADPRFGRTSNLALERQDIVDTGSGIDTVAVLQALHDQVSTATYRMDPEAQTPLTQDFYSPKIQPGSIRAGTAIYDVNGHVMIVYDVTADGSILYMDANPDQTVTRGTYGRQVPKSPKWLGGGFKNFRPLKLEGAVLLADGTYVGGHVVPAANDAIADYSLEQYRGNATAANDDDPNAQFLYNNASLNLYEYTRASMSNGGFAFNPVYELEITMGSLCRDAKNETREANARVKTGFAALYTDLWKIAELWKQHDLRVVYHGNSLKETLAKTYSAQEQACVVASSDDAKWATRNPLGPFEHLSPQTDVQMLIARIDESAPVTGMRPVGN